MALSFEKQGRTLLHERGVAHFALFAFGAIAGALGGAALEHVATARRRRRAPQRPVSRTGFLSSVAADASYALRSLRKSAGFTVLAVLTLGFGIAVNATLFSLVSAILFSELPAKDPDSFVWIYASNDELGKARERMSLPGFARLRADSQTLDGVAAIMGESFVVGDASETQRVKAARVSDNYHRVWGVEVVAGRGFTAGEERPGAEPVVILSHGFWERHYGSDPGVIGDVLRLDGTGHTIIGVLSKVMEFGEISTIDLWIPFRLDPEVAPREERRVYVQARLAAGTSVSAAREELTGIAARAAAAHTDTNDGWTLRVVPIKEELLNDEDQTLFAIAGLSVAFVLLIACANVANMLMARASSREKEVAVRLAMGASRSRLVRQLLLEGFVMAAGAALFGLLVTRALLDGLVYVTAEHQWLYHTASIDGRVWLFTGAISAMTPLLFGLLPSLRASRLRLSEALSEGGRTATARAGLRLRQTLVVVQLMMALVLMIVTGLLVRTVIELRTTDLGFRSAGVVAATIELPSVEYDEGSRLRFQEALLARVRSDARAVEASITDLHPFVPARPVRSFARQGESAEGDVALPTAQLFRASPGYFRTMGIPVLRGRDFAEGDDGDAAAIAVVSRSAVERYWPEAEAVGQTFRWVGSGSTDGVRIVGVVGDVLDLDSDRASHEPQIYLPIAQSPVRRTTLVARVTGDPGGTAGLLRAHVAALDASLLVDVQTLAEIEAEMFRSSNAIIALFVIFAGFALLMAAVGIYGVMSFAVSSRGREIGIRMALGANNVGLMRMVTGEGARIVAIGAGAGVVLALVVGRALESVLIGVTGRDPLTFALVISVLVSVSVVANYVPARRAMSVDPTRTLRAD